MGEERIDTIKLAKNFIACMNQLFNRSIVRRIRSVALFWCCFII